jgi:eukaryotic-like serine/threonine-protein kinase
MTGRTEVVHRGRRYPNLDRVRVYRTEYLVIARLGRGARERYKVFDRTAGPDGELRMLHVLPRSRHAEQQVKVLSRVARRNTAGPQILQYEVRDGKVFVVTTWLPGQDLASYLDDARAGRIPWPSAYLSFKMLRGFVHGLSRLHDRAHIVHGDIKPANLIIAARGAELSLVDYGSAWLEERTVGRDAGDGTTDGYAAPELRAAGAVADWRSDQFSATVVLYELLTGALPYDGMGGVAGWTENRAGFAPTYVPPSGARREKGELPIDAWRRIDEVVACGLQWDASARYASTGAWREPFDAVNALLHAPSELRPWSRRVVHAVEWLRGRFRRNEGDAS